ncbi:MAG: 5'-methylthioadenosine/S-adenosylhomocysteine nucleosidase [Candidatus Scatosoma sp.]
MITAVVAMESEAEILIKQAKINAEKNVLGKKVYEGEAYGERFALVVCGVGKVNAAIGASVALLTYRPQSLLNFGVAGGLNARTALCGVYAIDKAVQFDFDLTQLNGGKIGTLDEYTQNYLPLTPLDLPLPSRALGTADRFNDSTADYALLTKELGADIRDMEGAAIVQAALCAGVNAYCVKAISDVAGSGSTTKQFLKNRDAALANLQKALPEIFSAIARAEKKA